MPKNLILLVIKVKSGYCNATAQIYLPTSLVIQAKLHTLLSGPLISQ